MCIRLTCSTGSGKTLSVSVAHAGCSTTSGNFAVVTVSFDDGLVVTTVAGNFLELGASLSAVLSTGTHSP